MQKLLLLFSLILSFTFTKAQYYGIQLDTSADTLQAGNEHTYALSVNPVNNFSSSIYFSALPVSCFQGDISFSHSVLNTPYTVQSLTVKVKSTCPSGWYSIIIKAANGPAVEYDSLFLFVPDAQSTSGWKVYGLGNSPFTGFTFPYTIYINESGTLLYDYLSIGSTKGIGYFSKEWNLRKEDSVFTYNACGEIKSREYQSDQMSSNLKFGFSRVKGFRGVNSLIASDYNGFQEFDSSGRLLHTYNSQNSPINVDNAFFDIDGNIWITSSSAIARQKENGAWNVFTKSANGLPDATYTSAVELNGTFWFATDKGLIKYDGTFWTTYNSVNSTLSYDEIFKLSRVDGKICGSNYNSIFTVQNNKIISFVCPLLGLGEYINSFLAYGPDDFFVGKFKGDQGEGPLFRLKDGMWYSYNKQNSGFPVCVGEGYYTIPGYITDIKKDKKGKLWLATQGCGIVSFSPPELLVTGGIKASAEISKSILKLVPNPSSNGSFTVESDVPVNGLKVYDLLGNETASSIQPSISGLTKGVYLVKINTSRGVETEKLIILE